MPEASHWSRKDEESQPGDVGWRYRQLHRINDALEPVAEAAADGASWVGDKAAGGAAAVEKLFGGLF